MFRPTQVLKVLYTKVVIINFVILALVKILKDQNKRPGKYHSKNGPKTFPYHPLGLCFFRFCNFRDNFLLTTYSGLSP